MRYHPLQTTLPALLLSLVAIVISSSVTTAQGPMRETGSVQGVVATALNGQSYNISGASLKLKQEVQVSATSSSDAGEYEFTQLAPGEYTLEVSVEGFKTTSEPITVCPGVISVENVMMEVEDVTASVTVAASVQGVQTTETTSTNTIKQKTLQILPLQNEQLVDALTMVPGVVRGPDGQLDVVSGVFLPVAAQSQKVKSLTAIEKGHGVVISPIDEREVTSALVVLRENGTVLLALFSDIQLQADGTWSVSAASPQEIDLKITGGAIGGEVTGSGKLLLTEDLKSFKQITIEAQTCCGSAITVSVTFVADAAEQPDKDRSSL